MRDTYMEKKKIKLKYVIPKDYNPFYSNGVFGGLTTQGEININFFLERHDFPDEELYEVDEKGGLSLQKKPVGKSTGKPSQIVRHVSTGVILTPEVAKSVYDWLGEKLKLIDKITQQSEAKESNKSSV